jgi:hypothetical protein
MKILKIAAIGLGAVLLAVWMRSWMPYGLWLAAWLCPLGWNLALDIRERRASSAELRRLLEGV